MACDCINRVNENLQKRFNETALVNIEILSGRAIVNGVYRERKKDGSLSSREKEINLLATYCPFCGKRYEEEKK